MIRAIVGLISSIIISMSAFCYSDDLLEPATQTSFPKELELEFDNNTINLEATGMDIRSKFFVKIYIIVSYLQDAVEDNSEAVLKEIFDDAKAKQLTFYWLRQVESKKLKEGFLDSFHQNLSNEEFSKMKHEILQFLSFYNEDANANDQNFLKWFPGGIVEVYINDTKKGTITNQDFAKALWSIWFGAHSPVNRDNLIRLIVKK